MIAIRLLEVSREPTFTERLEERAHSVAGKRVERSWDSSALSILEQEIALTMQHIDGQKTLSKTVERALTSERFYVYGELVQQKRETHYRPYRPNSIENLKARLGQIDSELRRIAVIHVEALARLHERLLVQLSRHGQATNGNNGY